MARTSQVFPPMWREDVHLRTLWSLASTAQHNDVMLLFALGYRLATAMQLHVRPHNDVVMRVLQLMRAHAASQQAVHASDGGRCGPTPRSACSAAGGILCAYMAAGGIDHPLCPHGTAPPPPAPCRVKAIPSRAGRTACVCSHQASLSRHGRAGEWPCCALEIQVHTHT
jgi:hypothetical protein